MTNFPTVEIWKFFAWLIMHDKAQTIQSRKIGPVTPHAIVLLHA
jgi:hypothetical protein